MVKENIANTPITYRGETYSLASWCRILSLTYTTVRMRYTRGQRDVTKLFAPTPVSKDGWDNPYERQKNAKKVSAVLMPQMFYDLPAPVKQAIFDHLGYDKEKIRKYMVGILSAYVTKALINKKPPEVVMPDAVSRVDSNLDANDDAMDMLPTP
jgi:hypothetical protein